MSNLTEEQKLYVYDALVTTLIESGADNYLSLTFSRDGGDEEYEILIRRCEGMTDAQKNTKLEQRITELEREISELLTLSAMDDLKESLAKRDLEQQAKGVEDFSQFVGTSLDGFHDVYDYAEEFAEQLRNSAKGDNDE